MSNRESILADLLRETEDIETKRKACLETREILRRAMDIVNEVRSMSLPTTGASVRASVGGGINRAAGNHEDLDQEENKFISRRGKR
jgi:hypothetical protein